MTTCHVQTKPIPVFDLRAMSDRQQLIFGSKQSKGAGPNVTVDEESTGWPRSSFQTPLTAKVWGSVQAWDMPATPTDAYFDLENIRRDAVSETISALQSEADNTQSRHYLSRETFCALFKRHARHGWNAFFEQLESFSKLGIGWDGYRAKPPEKAAVLSAKRFLSQLTDGDPSPVRIKPSVVGGIGITFKANQRKCYVEFYNNGTVYRLFSDGLTEPETSAIPPTAQNYKILINEIRGYLNAGHP